LVNPNDFIPVAEETGIIVPIGEWVLRTACHQAKIWQEQFSLELTMSVNISSRQFREPEIVENVLSIVAETGISPDKLDLELTESTLMDGTDVVFNKMNRLRETGICISVDDFGTGYSSMSYLKRFPITTLKIDRSFVQDIPTDADDIAITQAIIAMGKSLGLILVAEGVETAEQMHFLREHRCDKLQGFLFSRPIPAHEAEALLKRDDNAVAFAIIK
jgi:EAL domain-containing protein (putative c-di-GMP-specific phosphodiesterase class I)